MTGKHEQEFKLEARIVARTDLGWFFVQKKFLPSLRIRLQAE